MNAVELYERLGKAIAEHGDHMVRLSCTRHGDWVEDVQTEDWGDGQIVTLIYDY